MHKCLLHLFNRMLATHFPKYLFVDMITADFKSAEKSDMSNYRGITVGPVFAKLFATIIQCRLASWAEKHGVKARGRACFRKDYRTADNIFVRRTLFDKQRQARQKEGVASCTAAVDFKKAFDTVPRAVLWQVLEAWVFKGGCWTSSSLCTHMTAPQCTHQKAFLRSSDTLWESNKVAR